MAPDSSGRPHVILSQAALQASLGVGATNNRSRLQQFDRTERVFDAAAEYRKKWEEYETYLKKKAEEDAKKLIEAFKGLQVVLDGISDLRSATASVKELRYPLVLGPWLEAESLYKSEPDSSSVWGANLANYKGVIAFGSFGSSPRGSRLLRAHVGRAIANGFNADRALRAVKLDAARALGVSDKLGSIEPDKQADISCFAGDPTSAASSVTLVVSAGKVVYRAADAPKLASDLANKRLETSSATSLPSRYALKTSRYLLPSGAIEPRIVAGCERKNRIDRRWYS